MSSTRNDESPAVTGIDERILESAARCVIDFGIDRVTIAEVARRAGVSRPTIYRRWPDTRTLVTSLLTREVLAAIDANPEAGTGRAALVDRIVGVAAHLRDDALIGAVLQSQPQIAMTYIADRLGTSQHAVIGTLAAAIQREQSSGTVRAGDPPQLATMVLLIAQSAIQSARMVAPILDEPAWSRELTHALNGYLAA